MIVAALITGTLLLVVGIVALANRLEDARDADRDE